MIKFGVTSLSELYHHDSQFGRLKHASVLLLRDLARIPDADLRWHDRIVSNIRMTNGTWRETRRDRFEILDPLIRDILAARFPSDTPLFVTDCGVSTGATSVELYRTLTSVFSDLNFVATDISFRALVVRSRRWPLAVAFDADGCELQIIAGPLVLPGQGRISIGYPLNRLARRIATATLVPRARSVLERAGVPDGSLFTEVRIDDYDVVAVPLLCVDCLHLAQSTANFRCEAHDVFQPTQRRAHMVRAMNVLTRAYFDDRTLRKAFAVTLDAVLPDGLFISGRSPTSNPHDLLATIFCRNATGLTVVSRVNGGCEEEDLILGAADTNSPSALKP